jgi:hypothetical protein
MAEMQSPAAGDGRARECSSRARDASQYTGATADTQYQLIARVRKNAREEFRVAIRKFANFRGVELRLYQANGRGEFVETTRAIAIRPQALPAIIAGLTEAGARL